MTSIQAPSYAAARAYGPLLTQFGAAKLDTSDAFVLKAVFPNAARAAVASATLRDAVDGAKLLVVSGDPTRNTAQPSVQGLRAMLSGVPEVATYLERRPQGGTDVLVSSPNLKTVEGLRQLLLVEPQLSELATVSVFHKPAGELPAPPAK